MPAYDALRESAGIVHRPRAPGNHSDGLTLLACLRHAADAGRALARRRDGLIWERGATSRHSHMARLVAETRIALVDAEHVIEPVCEHLVEHGARLERDGADWVLVWPTGEIRLSASPGQLLARASADDREGLFLLRLGVASHVQEFTREGRPEIAWTGDGSDIRTPPNYRAARVAAAREITPHMRRITLEGDDLARFMTDTALHVKLLLPSDPAGPLWEPTVGADGAVVWPAAEGAVRRTYTIRGYDAARGALDVDVALHDDPGPGARWAVEARPGDRVGVMGPGGGGAPRADWMLLAGDETALPAIARILETAPTTARGVAIIELGDDRDRQDFVKPDQVDVVWLRRSDGGLAEAVRERFRPDEGASRFLWAGCEFGDFKSIRRFARREVGLSRDEHLVAAYWRRGAAEGDAKASEK